MILISISQLCTVVSVKCKITQTCHHRVSLASKHFNEIKMGIIIEGKRYRAEDLRAMRRLHPHRSTNGRDVADRIQSSGWHTSSSRVLRIGQNIDGIGSCRRFAHWLTRVPRKTRRICPIFQ